MLLAVAVVLSGCVSVGSHGSQPGPKLQPPEAASPIPAPHTTPVPVAHLQNPPVQVTPMVTAIPTPTPTPLPLSYIPDTPEQAAARRLLNAQWGVYGFVVMDASGRVISSYNGATPFITASTYKLILMADILRRVEAGELALDDYLYLDPDTFSRSGGDMYFGWDRSGTYASVYDLLFAVGAWSSNVAALTLLPLTTPEDLRATAEEIGMLRTYLFANPHELAWWPPAPGIDSSNEDMAVAIRYIEDSFAQEGHVNITTPYDMAMYQVKLIRGEVVSHWVSEQIVGILTRQAIRDRLPVYNWDITVANKPGNLVGVVNDVGILYLPGGPRAVAAMSEAVPNDLHATHVVQLLGAIAAGKTQLW